MTPARVVYITVVGTILALALVLQSAAIRESGYRLEELRAEIAEGQTENAMHLAHISKLKSPRRVLALVEALGLGLEERPVPAAGTEGVPTDAVTDTSQPAPLADAPPGQPTTVASLAAGL